MIQIVEISGFKKIVHSLAGSIRQEGFPVFLADEDGKILWEGRASKRPQAVDLTGREVYLVHFYESNSGRRYVYTYRIAAETGEVWESDEFSQCDIRVVLDRLPGEAGQRAFHWLTS